MDYSVEVVVPPGTHFYRFKVGNKYEIDRKKPTGLDPQCEYLQIFDCRLTDQFNFAYI